MRYTAKLKSQSGCKIKQDNDLQFFCTKNKENINLELGFPGALKLTRSPAVARVGRP